MNREIKFRAWDDDNMLFDFFNFIDLNKTIQTLEEVGSKFLMQLTPLKDKNEKDIYEFDILKIQWQIDSIGGYLQSPDSYVEKEETAIVERMNIGWGFKKKDGKFFSLPKNCEIEVIGNIYKNPEILK